MIDRNITVLCISYVPIAAQLNMIIRYVNVLSRGLKLYSILDETVQS